MTIVKKILNNIGSHFLLFILASLYFFTMGFQAIITEVVVSISILVIVFFIVILIIQVISLKLIFVVTRSELVKVASAGLFLAGNLITFYLAFFPRFQNMPEYQNLIIAIFGTVIFTLIFKWSRWNSKISIFVCLLIIGNLFISGLISATSDDKNTVTGSLQRYENITFKDRPNLHLVMYDSMLPATLAEKHMGIPNLSYHDYLKSEKAIIFKNMFASDAPTKPSVNSIMRLANPDFQGYRFFSGHQNSPVAYIFKNNGYNIATGYRGFTFGDKGPHIDEYNTEENQKALNPKNLAQSDLCFFNGRKEHFTKLYGLCYFLPPLLPGTQISQPITNAKIDSASNNEFAWAHKVIDIIKSKGSSNQPWLTFHHTYNPIGHTVTSHRSDSAEDLKKYTEHFVRQSNILTEEILPTLIKSIHMHDPNSLVLIFGDHGVWLSTTSDKSTEQEFIILDRYAIFTALLNTNHSCNSNDINYYTDTYSTPERLLAGIIRCLSNNPRSIDSIMKFDEVEEYKDYIYE
tara:strand:- start:413 stop:1966 length:1554 start_codon:yes stop_codon:yes gene_type:complete